MRARARDVARDVGVDAAQVGVESALGALEVEHGDVDVGDGDAVDARGGRARGEGRAHGARDATRRRAEVCGRSEHGRSVGRSVGLHLTFALATTRRARTVHRGFTATQTRSRARASSLVASTARRSAGRVRETSADEAGSARARAARTSSTTTSSGRGGRRGGATTSEDGVGGRIVDGALASGLAARVVDEGKAGDFGERRQGFVVFGVRRDVLVVELGNAEMEPTFEGVHRAESQRRDRFVHVGVRHASRLQALAHARRSFTNRFGLPILRSNAS